MQITHSLRKLLVASLFGIYAINAPAQEQDIMVVANIDNQTVKLDKVDIRNLFMGNASDVVLEPQDNRFNRVPDPVVLVADAL